MKSFFIINPAAGKEAGKQEFIKTAEDIGQKLKMNVSVYTTKEKGDGFRFVREVCSTFRGEELRFFACGGDGTMNEVINALDGTEKYLLESFRWEQETILCGILVILIYF